MLLNRSDRRKDGGDKLKPKEFIQHFYYINKDFKFELKLGSHINTNNLIAMR